MKKRRLLNTLISTGNYKEFVDEIIRLSQQSKSSYVCISNVHMLIEAYRDKEYNKVVNEADIATPDGMPLAKSLSLIYGLKQDRVAGMDIMPSLLKESESKSLSVYFYGSSEETLDLIISKSKIEYPSLIIAGHYSPPFKLLSEEEKQDIITKINNSNPDFVLVALGCPKQEKWMAEHKNKVNSCMLGVGGAFGVYAGIQDRAPQWMQKLSLEWLFRFSQEPSRLWKRYLITNSMFCFLIIKFGIEQFIKNLFYNTKKISLWTGQAQEK